MTTEGSGYLVGAFRLSELTMGTRGFVPDNGDNGDRAAGVSRGDANEGWRSSAVDDQLNVPLEDVELLAEVELTTNLIIAASEADHTLSQAEIDRILGVDSAVGVPPNVPSQQVRSD